MNLIIISNEFENSNMKTAGEGDPILLNSNCIILDILTTARKRNALISSSRTPKNWQAFLLEFQTLGTEKEWLTLLQWWSIWACHCCLVMVLHNICSVWGWGEWNLPPAQRHQRTIHHVWLAQLLLVCRDAYRMNFYIGPFW